MKSFCILALVCMVGCQHPINVEAPMVVRVDGVAVESLTDEAPYVPTVKWNVHAYIPNQDLEIWGSTEDMPNGDRDLQGHVWKWGPMTASTTLEGDKIRLDCSNGSAGTFTCLNNDATMRATCERMVFKFNCTRM
jgi:hypothetical protein